MSDAQPALPMGKRSGSSLDERAVTAAQDAKIPGMMNALYRHTKKLTVGRIPKEPPDFFGSNLSSLGSGFGVMACRCGMGDAEG